MATKDELLKQDMKNLTFSADLNLTMDQVRTIVAAYITTHRGKVVLPEDVSFSVTDSYTGHAYEPYQAGYFTTKVKVRL
jgi:methionine aminopeptidase